MLPPLMQMVHTDGLRHRRVVALLVAMLVVTAWAPTVDGASDPSAVVALNGAEFRPGQLLAIGMNVENPLGEPAALILGVLLPDGQSVILLSTAGQVTFSGAVAKLSALPTEAVPPNFSFSSPGFLQFTFPAEGVPPGTYQVFAALMRVGALADESIDPEDTLAVDVKPFTFSTEPPPGAIPFLYRPFSADYPVGSFFDHLYPLEFSPSNGVIVPYWGEQLAVPSEVNHEGYDFLLPEGTPVLAAGDGRVVLAGLSAPSYCPLLDTVVQGNRVDIAHLGVGFRTSYHHLSRVDVQVGQLVSAGQVLGLSGNTGCSTGPHLHFEVFRVDLASGRVFTTDPYGWAGASPDPWAMHPEGGPSVWLWQDGQAPPVYREGTWPPNGGTPPLATAPVTITRWRWMGVRDDVNPNNEFIELTLDPRFAAGGEVDLTGFTLRNHRGDAYAFPPGFTIREGQPVRVFTGPGASTATDLFWGLGRGVWDNVADCVQLISPSGGVYRIRYGPSNVCG